MKFTLTAFVMLFAYNAFAGCEDDPKPCPVPPLVQRVDIGIRSDVVRAGGGNRDVAAGGVSIQARSIELASHWGFWDLAAQGETAGGNQFGSISGSVRGTRAFAVSRQFSLGIEGQMQAADNNRQLATHSMQIGPSLLTGSSTADHVYLFDVHATGGIGGTQDSFFHDNEKAALVTELGARALASFGANGSNFLEGDVARRRYSGESDARENVAQLRAGHVFAGKDGKGTTGVDLHADIRGIGGENVPRYGVKVFKAF
jgi:hypothetical protein